MVEINGKPVRPVDAEHRAIVLAFDVDRGTFSGRSGCSDLGGRFETTEVPLKLTSYKLWRICRADEQTERAVRSIVRDTRRYRLSGTTLELLDVKGVSLAKLGR